MKTILFFVLFLICPFYTIEPFSLELKERYTEIDACLLEEMELKIAIDLSRDLIIKFEGFSDTPYKCSSGVWTIGYGTTRKVSSIQKRSESFYRSLLEAEIERILSNLNYKEEFKYLEPPKKAALVSLIYNIGDSSFNRSNLHHLITSGDYTVNDIEREYFKWVKSKGVELRGLKKRRKEELKYWKKC